MSVFVPRGPYCFADLGSRRICKDLGDLRVGWGKVVGPDNIDVALLILLQVIHDVGPHVGDAAVARERDAAHWVVVNEVQQRCTERPATVLPDLRIERGTSALAVNFRAWVGDFGLWLDVASGAHVLWREGIDASA